jgi:hypothetical protein
MKIGGVRIAGVSVALLIVQLGIAGSIAAKYLYQRWTCPRVWVRAAAYDPELLMRGRYLSLQVTVDGCQSTLPSHAEANFPRRADGTVAGPRFTVRTASEFPARLEVKDNRLLAFRLPNEEEARNGQYVTAGPGAACDAMRLAAPVNLYIAEHAAGPFPLHPGEELWMEVTLPPKGPPRPLQLALKRSGQWIPLAYQ